MPKGEVGYKFEHGGWKGKGKRIKEKVKRIKVQSSM
jgi:hypothetical protein